METYKFATSGEPVTVPTTLPVPLSGGEWEQKQLRCQEAGYDLTPYAGQTLSLTKIQLVQGYYYSFLFPQATIYGMEVVSMEGELPLSLWVVSKDQATVCSYVSLAAITQDYLTLRQTGYFTSDVFAVNDVHIR